MVVRGKERAHCSRESRYVMDCSASSLNPDTHGHSESSTSKLDFVYVFCLSFNFKVSGSWFVPFYLIETRRMTEQYAAGTPEPLYQVKLLAALRSGTSLQQLYQEGQLCDRYTFRRSCAHTSFLSRDWPGAPRLPRFGVEYRRRRRRPSPRHPMRFRYVPWQFI